MAYVRKTRDIWCIETNYGYGWEVEATYDTWTEVQRNIHDYRILTNHYNGICRIVKRRERIS